jgi:hypothetical protein
MAALFTNNATTTLSGSILSGDTSISVTASTGALFPAPTGTDYFYATLIDASNNIEIVKVTARTTDTMTVVRAQEGTTARAYASGDKFELRPTAAGLNSKFDKEGGTITGAVTVGGALTLQNSSVVLPSGTTAFSVGTANFSVGLQVGGVAVVSLSGSQTLTNKTLTAPVISTISNTGTLTLPTSTDTLVGRATTDTLTNKTITGLATTSTIKDAGGTSYTLGYRGAPLATTGATAYTFALGDESIVVPRTAGGWVIPANASVAFATDTILMGFNDSASTQTLTITTDTLRLNGTTSTGARTVPAYGLWGAKKVSSTTWVAWGVS